MLHVQVRLVMSDDKECIVVHYYEYIKQLDSISLRYPEITVSTMLDQDFEINYWYGCVFNSANINHLIAHVQIKDYILESVLSISVNGYRRQVSNADLILGDSNFLVSNLVGAYLKELKRCGLSSLDILLSIQGTSLEPLFRSVGDV